MLDETEFLSEHGILSRRLNEGNLLMSSGSKVRTAYSGIKPTRDLIGSLLLALVSKDRLVKILERMLDETEFLSEHGIRSMLRYVWLVLDEPVQSSLERGEFVDELRL
jgi:hypothetical protein